MSKTKKELEKENNELIERLRVIYKIANSYSLVDEDAARCLGRIMYYSGLDIDNSKQ